jgi:hypothetical protein
MAPMRGRAQPSRRGHVAAIQRRERHMAVFEDMFKGASLPGLAVGVGVAVLAPVVLPVVGRMLRPAAKSILRTGIAAWREASAQVSEAAGPIVAEARSEMAGPREP